MLLISKAIVLWRWPAGEYDREICMYTKKLGLITLKAKGVRKPGAKLISLTEPFAVIEAWLSWRPYKTWGKLLSAVLVNSHPVLRQNPDKVAAAAYVSELTREVCPPVLPAPDIFSLIERTLEEIENHHHDDDNVLDSLRYVYAINLLTRLGYGMPNVSESEPLHFLSHINQYLRMPLKSEEFIESMKMSNFENLKNSTFGIRHSKLSLLC